MEHAAPSGGPAVHGSPLVDLGEPPPHPALHQPGGAGCSTHQANPLRNCGEKEGSGRNSTNSPGCLRSLRRESHEDRKESDTLCVCVCGGVTRRWGDCFPNPPRQSTPGQTPGLVPLCLWFTQKSDGKGV